MTKKSTSGPGKTNQQAPLPANKPAYLNRPKLRLGDVVFRIGKPDRHGTIWELRPNGRASVTWHDSLPIEDPRSGAKCAHVLLVNLERV